jgi:cyclophilin family peptidyl-prolyl cis-trans isomerase
MMKYCRLLPLTLAAYGCVSCSSIKTTVDKINPFSKKDATAEVAGAEAEEKAMNADVPAGANDAVITVDVGGSRQRIVIHLRPDLAPKHVANFKKMVASGYYDGLAVHRAIRGYLIQTGDPLSKDDGNKVNWGTGGPDFKIPSEAKGKHVKGSVAAARLGDSLNPDKSSSASQFYVMLRPAKGLDGNYTVFGEITQGLDVVEKISAQTVDTNDMPVKRVEIKNIRLVSPGSSELDAPKKKAGKTVPEAEKGIFTRMIERIW